MTLKKSSDKIAINLWILEISQGKKKRCVGYNHCSVSWYILFLFWSAYWHVSWRLNFKGTYWSRDVSGELVISKPNCYWHEPTAALLPALLRLWAEHNTASATDGRSEHAPPAQGQRKDSGSEVASSSASSCWASLRASFGFQSSFASNPKPSVYLCPCLPDLPSLIIFPTNYMGLNLLQFSIWFNESQSPYR